MPTSHEFPGAQVKLRIEGDQVRTIISGGVLREPIRLGTSIHSAPGRELVRQVLASKLDALDWGNGRDWTTVTVISPEEVSLKAHHWLATITKLNSSTLDLMFVIQKEKGFDRHMAVHHISGAIKALGWPTKINISPNSGIEVDLLLSLESEDQNDGTYTLRNLRGTKLVGYDLRTNVIWAKYNDVSDAGYLSDFVASIARRILVGKPRLLIWAPGLSSDEHKALDAILSPNDLVLGFENGHYSLMDEDSVTVAEVRDTHTLTPVAAPDSGYSIMDMERLADFVNLVDGSSSYTVGLPVPVKTAQELAKDRLRTRMLQQAIQEGQSPEYRIRLIQEIDLMLDNEYSFQALLGLDNASGAEV